MKNALILHGAGNTSQGNWFPWLKTQLETLGYQVWSPDLPNSDIPIEKDWLEVIFSNHDWTFNSESLLIGHSAGATLALRILEKLPKQMRIHQTILVACPIDKGSIREFFPYKEDITREPFDWQRIKNSCNTFTFIASDNDQYDCGERHAKIMHNKLGGELIIKAGQGHFNLETGYKEFPLLLNLIQ